MFLQLTIYGTNKPIMVDMEMVETVVSYTGAESRLTFNSGNTLDVSETSTYIGKLYNE